MSDAELPAGWVWATLGDVARWGSGGTPKKGIAHYYGGDIPWAVIGDLNDGPILTTTSTITNSGLENSSAKWVPEDAVLVAMYGSIGKLGITRRAMTTNQAIAFAVSDTRQIDTRYLFWYLRSTRNLLVRSGRGGTQQNISQAILKSLPIPVAPLTEQRRIVEALEGHLSRLTAAEQSINQALTRGRRLVNAVSDITYGYAVAPGDPCTAPPSPSGVEDGAIPVLQPSWSWKRLEEIADVVGGVTKDKKKQSDPELPEIPYLRVANVQRGRLDLSEISTIRVTENKASQLALRKGDVLLNEGGDRDKLGRGWIWEGQVPGAIHQNHVFRARVRDNVIHPKLLSWHANSSSRWFELNGKQSVNLASISLSKIKKFPVPVPPLDEQAKIVERIESQLSVVNNATTLAKQALSKTGALRKALLTKAFTGRLVPQDPSDEPASVLLDRVRAAREAQATNKGKAKRAPRPRNSAAISKSAPPPPPEPSVPAPTTDAVQQELPL